MRVAQRTASILALCLVLTCGVGCVSSQFMPVGGATYPPRPEGYIIDVYLPTDAPVVVHQEVPISRPLAELPKAARTIGRIDTQGAPAAGWGSLFMDAQEKARTLGGDAVVVRRWGSPVVGVDSYGAAQYGKAISMEVVRFRD
jgi:hypothetical protein